MDRHTQLTIDGDAPMDLQPHPDNDGCLLTVGPYTFHLRGSAVNNLTELVVGDDYVHVDSAAEYVRERAA